MAKRLNPQPSCNQPNSNLSLHASCITYLPLMCWNILTFIAAGAHLKTQVKSTCTPELNLAILEPSGLNHDIADSHYKLSIIHDSNAELFFQDLNMGYRMLAAQKWVSFVGATWIMAISGTNFDFSNYSTDLKTVLDINEFQLNNLGVASDVGRVIGWLSGFAFRLLPTWAALTIGVLVGFFGYGAQWLVVSKIIDPLPYFVMYMLSILGGYSICWLNAFCIRVVLFNFPAFRGIAIGLSMSYMGLGTVIFSNLLYLINSEDASLCLLLNALVPGLFCAIGAPLIHVPQPHTVTTDENDQKNMYILTLTAIVTAIYSALYVFLPHEKLGLQGLYLGILAILLLSLLYVPVKVAFCQERDDQKTVPSESSDPNRIFRIDMEANLSSAQQISWKQYIKEINSLDFYDLDNSKESTKHTEIIRVDTMNEETPSPNIAKRSSLKRAPSIGEEHNVRQLFRSVDFWLYYFMYICVGTVGTLYTNNLLDQIIRSLGHSKTPELVSLATFSAFIGRIASGLPDFLKGIKESLPTPAWLGIWTLPMLLALFTMAFCDGNRGVLYVSTAIIGMSSGALSSAAVVTSSELFGILHCTVNHNILLSTVAIGSIVFDEMAEMLYDRYATIETSNMNSHGLLCVGRDCFATTFVVWGCVCLLGILVNVILVLRTRNLYKFLYCMQNNNTSL